MNKAEAIEKLQDSAREIALLVKWFQKFGQNRLAEYATVWHLVNFKVQEIIGATSIEKVDSALYGFRYDLTMQMEYYRDNRIEHLADFYGSALDGFDKATEVISDYLK